MSRRFAVLLMLAAAGASAAEIEIRAERSGDAVEVHASARLAADPASAWTVLTDYDRYATFIPDLRSSRIIARGEGGHVRVEQKGDARLAFLKLPVEVVYDVEERPTRSLHSRAVGGSIKEIVSLYELSPSGDGCRLVYSGRIVPHEGGPGVFDVVLVRATIARQFRALAAEIERFAASSAPASMRPSPARAD